MNLNSIVSAAIGSVNPQIEICVLQSTGYTTNPDSTRTPTYAAPVTVFAQVQELTARDLAKLDGLNLQAINRAVYLNGAVAGVVRSAGKGGDVMKFLGQTWLVTAIPERWPGWTKCVVTQQAGS